MSPTVSGIEAQTLSRYSVLGLRTKGAEEIRLEGQGWVSFRSTIRAKERRPFIVIVNSGRTSPRSSVQPTGRPSDHFSNPALFRKAWPSGRGLIGSAAGFRALSAAAAIARDLNGWVGGVKFLVRRMSLKIAKSSRNPFDELRPPT